MRFGLISEIFLGFVRINHLLELFFTKLPKLSLYLDVQKPQLTFGHWSRWDCLQVRILHKLHSISLFRYALVKLRFTKTVFYPNLNSNSLLFRESAVCQIWRYWHIFNIQLVSFEWMCTFIMWLLYNPTVYTASCSWLCTQAISEHCQILCHNVFFILHLTYSFSFLRLKLNSSCFFSPSLNDK